MLAIVFVHTASQLILFGSCSCRFVLCVLKGGGALQLAVFGVLVSQGSCEAVRSTLLEYCELLSEMTHVGWCRSLSSGDPLLVVCLADIRICVYSKHSCKHVWQPVWICHLASNRQQLAPHRLGMNHVYQGAIHQASASYIVFCVPIFVCSQCLRRNSCYLPGSGHCLTRPVCSFMLLGQGMGVACAS
jgi:hypothetical protein